MFTVKTFPGGKAVLRVIALATVGTALSGCVYNVGLGYASEDYYECDPYGGFDSYYECDFGYGFSNIGYGGGWYDSFYYPGYGIFLFDNYGSRHRMRDHHRRYWGERRHRWYRDNRGRDEGRGRDGRGGGYTDNDNWDNNDSTGRDDRRGRGDGRRDGNGRWQGGQGNDSNAAPPPTPEATTGRGDGRRRWRGSDGSGAVQSPQPEGSGRRGEGRDNRYRQPPPSDSNATQPAVAPVVPDFTPRADAPPVAAPPPRQGRRNAKNVKDD